MAGTQDPNENPVAINVVPMVDVIFCLCIFFMCSLKFTELEGKFKSWLPKDKGQTVSQSQAVPEEIRFAVFWDEQSNRTRIKFVTREITGDKKEMDETIQGLIRDSKADFDRKNKPKVPVIIDGDSRVPWEEILNIVNLAKRENVENIEFAAGKKR
jgi:biopolymer transport protein ExbD